MWWKPNRHRVCLLIYIRCVIAAYGLQSVHKSSHRLGQELLCLSQYLIPLSLFSLSQLQWGCIHCTDWGDHKSQLSQRIPRELKVWISDPVRGRVPSGVDCSERRFWCGTSWLRGQLCWQFSCAWWMISFPPKSQREREFSLKTNSLSFCPFSPALILFYIIFIYLSYFYPFHFASCSSFSLLISSFCVLSVCCKRWAIWSLLW